MIKDMYFCINPVGQKIKTSGLTMTQYSTNAVLHLVSVGRYDNVEVSFRYPNGRVSDQYHMALVGKYQLRDSDTEPMMTQNADDLYEYSMPIPYKVTSSTVQGTSARINVGFSCFKYDPNTAMQVQIAVANTQIIMNASTDSDTIDEGYKQTEVDNLWKTVNKQANDIDEIKNHGFTLKNGTIEGGTIRDAKLTNITVDGELLNLSKYAIKTDVSNEIDGKVNGLAAVAKTGSYNDLKDKPVLFSGSYNDLSNKPSLFSGSYNDLKDKPTIPSLSGMASEDYVDSAIKSSMSSVYKFKGSVGSYSKLPSGASVGDTYNVDDTGMNYAWTGSIWDALGSTVDLNDYVTDSDLSESLKTKADSNKVYSKNEVDSLLLAKANDGSSYTKSQSDANYDAKGSSAAVASSVPTDITSVGNGLQLSRNGTPLQNQTPVQFKTINGKYIVGSGDITVSVDNIDMSEYLKSEDAASTYATIASVKSKANIVDVYDKTTMDALLTDKADANTTYTKSKVNELLDSKADSIDTYTKAQVDTSVNNIDSKFSNYYGKSTVDSLLDAKADSGKVFTKEEINDKLSDYALKSQLTGLYKFKGSVAKQSQLPSENNILGDVYNVEQDNMNYAWDGNDWDPLGSTATVDLSEYYKSTDVDAKLAVKADSSSVYSKTAADGRFATISDVNKKLDSNSGSENAESAYCVSNSNGIATQEMILVSNSAASNSIPKRSSAGQITVPASPTENTDAASKAYVDSQLQSNLADYMTSKDINSALALKQGVLTFDNYPVSGSSNPVTSGGIYSAIAAKTSLPSMTGHSGKFLTTNGSTASWAEIKQSEGTASVKFRTWEEA